MLEGHHGEVAQRLRPRDGKRIKGKSVLWRQQGGCTYEFIVVVIVCTGPVESEAWQNLSIEVGRWTHSPPLAEVLVSVSSTC